MPDTWSTDARERRRVTDAVRARHRPCCICLEPIDYSLRWPNARSFSVQHIKSRKAFPELTFDLANCDAAHLDCNQSQGVAPVITERVTSRRW
jgi:hypothetical protein